MNFFKNMALFLLVLLAGTAAIAIYWTFFQPLPDYERSVEMDGLSQQVQLNWDTFGVPHIYAETEEDLYFAIGYAHAQDRRWQMMLSQMLAEGRLAEFFGKDLLEYDQLQRTIGIWRMAENIEAELSNETRSALEAYAAGVNSYTENNPRSLPVQFTLTDIEPIEWTPTHSIALIRLMGWQMNIAWKTELNYAHLFETLPDEQLQQLFPGAESWLNTPDTQEADTTDADTSSLAQKLSPIMQQSSELRSLTGTEGSTTGSNAWAVNSTKSRSEAPILAGDPHLPLHIPGTWYEAHYNLNGQNLSGATIPGNPGIVIGQNDFMAWSITNVMLDDTDFFAERLNPDDSNQFERTEANTDSTIYKDFTIQREVIKIKNADDTTFTRRVNRHGPVISDVAPRENFPSDSVVTMQWTGQEVTHEIEALLNMGWSTSFNEFERWASDIKVPALNIIYADRADTIAHLTAAHVPVRDGNPIAIREGWNPDHDWQEFVPYDELPREVNPERGWVANANNDITPEDYPYYLSAYWLQGSRYQRIQQYLNHQNLVDTEIFQAMQNDTYSDYSSQLSSAILPALREEEEQFETAISYLENWDHTYTPSETAASIMDVFLLQLAENTFADDMDSETYRQVIQYPSILADALLRMLQTNDEVLLFNDDFSTRRSPIYGPIIRQSMQQALDFLEEQYGQEPFEWRWENLHQLHLKPEFLGQAAEEENAPAALKKIVDNLFSKRNLSAGGHHFSLNNGEYSWDEPFDMTLGPSIRRIVDLSDLEKTLSILPTGQSENPLSEYYGDQTNSWLQGEYKYLYQHNRLFQGNQYRTTTLVPEQ